MTTAQLIECVKHLTPDNKTLVYDIAFMIDGHLMVEKLFISDSESAHESYDEKRLREALGYALTLRYAPHERMQA